MNLNTYKDNFAHKILTHIADDIDDYEDAQGQDIFNAYITGIFLYSALSQMSLLLRDVKIYCEDENESDKGILNHINSIFENNPSLLSQIYVNESTYSDVLIYKVKSKYAILEETKGHKVSLLRENAIGDLEVINKYAWMHHYGSSGESLGYFVKLHNDAFESISLSDAIYITDSLPPYDKKFSLIQITFNNCIIDGDVQKSLYRFFSHPNTVNDIVKHPVLPVTTSELKRYKESFELMWLGHTAYDVNFEFDHEIIEKVSMVLGMDREIIWIPEGSSSERMKIMKERTYKDAITPSALKYLSALNYIGLPLDMKMHIHIPDGIDQKFIIM